MDNKLIANEETIKEAVGIIIDALYRANIPKLEGACAMRAILNQLADEGLDVRSERNCQA